MNRRQQEPLPSGGIDFRKCRKYLFAKLISQSNGIELHKVRVKSFCQTFASKKIRTAERMTNNWRLTLELFLENFNYFYQGSSSFHFAYHILYGAVGKVILWKFCMETRTRV